MPEFPTKGARPVWIASYPRSGNTFLRIILETVFQLPSYSLYYVEGQSHRDPSAEALQQAPRLPRNWRDAMVQDPQAPPVLIKTHGPPDDDGPAIFIVRDGHAAIHSYYHYHRKFAFEQPSLTEVIAGACQFGSWSDHYRAWRPKTRPGTLLLRYDELVGRVEQTISRLAEFLNLTPAGGRLPAFEELQRKLPGFFRRGPNTDYLQEWSSAQLALFNELHGGAMEDLGIPVVVPEASGANTAPELAHSAARLHRLYLEQLTAVGRSAAAHREEVQRLSQQVEALSQQVQQTLEPLFRNRWMRLGVALGAVEPPVQPPRNLPREAPSVSAAAANPPPARRVKAPGENTQSSSRALPQGPLSAPSVNTSGRV